MKGRTVYDTILIPVDEGLTVKVGAFYSPANEPQVQHIFFEPGLGAEDITYKKDIILPIGKTIISHSVIRENLEHCYLRGESLFELIQKHL